MSCCFISGENNFDSLQCTFNPVAGNLIITDGTAVGLRRDLNGMYLLKTALQTPVENARDGEVVLEMTLPDVSQSECSSIEILAFGPFYSHHLSAWV